MENVITSPFWRPAASCRGGRSACVNLAGVCQPRNGSTGQSCWSEAALRAGRQTSSVAASIPPPSPAAAAASPPRDICLVRGQKRCEQDNQVVLSLPHDGWRSTKSLPVTLRLSALIMASGCDQIFKKTCGPSFIAGGRRSGNNLQ